MQEKELVHKATLESGKILYFKDMNQGTEEMALKSAEARGGTSEVSLGYYMADETAKLLLFGYELAGKVVRPSASELEIYWSKLTYKDVRQIRKVVASLMGEEGAAPQIELVSGGL